jgi:1-acyl-sn-glycerol-3-phosphate acyltransferase
MDKRSPVGLVSSYGRRSTVDCGGRAREAHLKLYDVVTTVLTPFNRWGRVRLVGMDLVPEQGPLLIVPNHDSQWDPVVIGVGLRRRRRLRYLARASLWDIPALGPILSGIGQIQVRRGEGDDDALGQAIEALREGEALCVFPEGRLSWGEPTRAHSGVGRLLQACPGTAVVLCAVEGTTDYARFPRRPRVRVTFFRPRKGDTRPVETPAEVATRLLDEIRTRVPPTPAGRRALVGGPPRVRRARAS